MSLTGLKQKTNEIIYSNIIKRIAFKFDAERVHNSFTLVGRFLGSNFLTRKIIEFDFSYQNKKLEQNILGIHFRNPIGLAAGFDYNADLVKILPGVGFGFGTIGSVTHGKYGGNEKPRLGRLPNSRSLLVNKGLKNKGAKAIAGKIKNIEIEIPLGVSIAKTNCKETCDEKEGIKDYINCIKEFEKVNVGNYYELNISCPNAFGGEDFTEEKKLDRLLTETDKLELRKPLFLKMPVDFSVRKTEELCNIAKNHKVEGLIFGNLTKNRKRKEFDREEMKRAGKGAFSGLPTKEASNKLIAFVRKKYKRRFVIIGLGGVFSAQDVYEKIKLGADLVQLITGMIYNGPSLIGKINYRLTKLIEKEGFNNIREAVGKGLIKV